jgi:hypothetical protein
MNKYFVLCEDAQSACFIRRFLKLRNIENHAIREEIAPAGEGSARHWVRQQYPKFLNDYVRKGGLHMIVCVDADTATVMKTQTDLDNACKTMDVASRTPTECVAFVIPRRNIETWLGYLSGQTVDEITDYSPHGSHRANKSTCESAVRTLAEYCYNQKKPKVPFPASLDEACKEARRIDL